MAQAIFAAGLGVVLLIWAASVYPRLWRCLVERPADFLNALTLRKVVLGLGLILLLIVLAQTAPADMAFFLASDALTYLEIVAALWIAAASAQSRNALRLIARNAARQARKLRATGLRVAASIDRLARQRAPALRKLVARLSPPPDDPEPGLAFA